MGDQNHFCVRSKVMFCCVGRMSQSDDANVLALGTFDKDSQELNEPMMGELGPDDFDVPDPIALPETLRQQEAKRILLCRSKHK